MANRSPRDLADLRPPRLVVRREAGLNAYEAALARAGFDPVAGADEAGRGACAGPLVVAACILPPGRRGQIEDLDDSKLLTAAVRERLYDVIVRAGGGLLRRDRPGRRDRRVRAARGQPRRACAAPCARCVREAATPSPTASRCPGSGMPATAVWKGDATVACIAAASILAKVTRDAIMTELHEHWPDTNSPSTRATSPPATPRRWPNSARAPSIAAATSTCAGRCAGSSR